MNVASLNYHMQMNWFCYNTYPNLCNCFQSWAFPLEIRYSVISLEADYEENSGIPVSDYYESYAYGTWKIELPLFWKLLKLTEKDEERSAIFANIFGKNVVIVIFLKNLLIFTNNSV